MSVRVLCASVGADSPPPQPGEPLAAHEEALLFAVNWQECRQVQQQEPQPRPCCRESLARTPLPALPLPHLRWHPLGHGVLLLALGGHLLE